MSGLILLITAGVVLIFAAMLFIPAKISFSYRDKKAEVGIKYGILKKENILSLRKKRTKATEKPEKKSASSGDGGIDAFFNILSAFYEVSDLIRKSIKIEKLTLNARYGNADAAFTGMAIGIFYAEIYKLISFVSCVFTVTAPSITVTPDYSDEPVLEAEFGGIVKAKPVHIIIVCIKYMKKYKSYR